MIYRLKQLRTRVNNVCFLKLWLNFHVSGAYAWVKGNHIDHYVALACEQHGVESKLAKAGLTWQYLKFTHENEKILFIVKNARYFDPKQVDKGKDATGRTRQQTNSYMYNLMQILEKEIGQTIDAYSLWTDDNRPYIILGTIKKSAARRNFDLAHELGHLLLHYKVEFNMHDRKTYRAYEDEANSFASEFLLPEKAFKEECKDITKLSNPDSYIDLKQK